MRDRVFISYSHRDARWLERLQVYLAPLERRGCLRRWDDTLIAPGMRWEDEILAALERAKVAVLLVSADFLASDFIARVELPRLLGSAEDQGVLIIPLVLDHCNFERVPELAQFQAINSPARPLETLPEPEQKAVLAKLAAAVEDALAATAQASAAAPAERGLLTGLPARNPLFTGRDEALDAVSAALQRTGRAALCGLPGIGKSETAIEYAHRRRMAYARVLWSRGESEQHIVRGFCAFATALALPEAAGSNQLATAQAARAALERASDWLLVIDAAEDFALLRTWLPGGAGGHVLITTRNAAVSGLAEPVELDPLAAGDGARFLLRRARLAGGDASDPQLMAAAEALARATDGLPLALEQAGGYIEETACGLDEYLALWRAHCRQLLAERGQGSLREGDSLFGTWSLSLQELQRASPAALALLRLASFYSGDGLPETALQAGAALAGPELAPVLADPIARNAAIREALRYAFLRRDAKTRKLSLHRLMQQFIREELPPEAQRACCARALDVLGAAFPQARFADWPQCDALAAHGAAVLEHARALALATPAMARLACELGYYYFQRARYGEAAPLAAQALALRAADGAATAAERARAAMVAGQIELARNSHAGARERFGQAIALLAPAGASVDLAAVTDLLGSVDLACDQLEQAEARFGEARAIAQAAGAAHSVEAAQAANDLGAALFKRGDYAGARAAFGEAAQLRRALLPPAHPSIAQSLNNLAAVCVRLGERAAARSHYREALALREAALGAQHPDVAATLVNIALLDLGEDQPGPARTALLRALAIEEACRGPEHLAVAKVRACLGDVALHERRLDEAEALYGEARATRERLLGARHPDSARAMLGLADVALARADAARALALLREARAILAEELGPAHPDVAACDRDVARLAAANAVQA